MGRGREGWGREGFTLLKRPLCPRPGPATRPPFPSSTRYNSFPRLNLSALFAGSVATPRMALADAPPFPLRPTAPAAQATVCGGSMALRMAGVPIKDMVAGISVGLVTQRWPKPRGGPARSDWTSGMEDYGDHALLLGERRACWVRRGTRVQI